MCCKKSKSSIRSSSLNNSGSPNVAMDSFQPIYEKQQGIHRAPSYYSESASDPLNSPQSHRLNSSLNFKIAVKTLSSGFPYNQDLCDLGIDRTKWSEFSDSVTNATKLNHADRAAVVTATSGLSLTGLLRGSRCASKRDYEQRQLERTDTTRRNNTSVVQVLSIWNEHYFRHLGLRASVEVAKAALLDEGRKSGRCCRKRRVEEQTFMIVLSRIGWVHEKCEDLIAELAVDKPSLLEPPAYDFVSEKCEKDGSTSFSIDEHVSMTPSQSGF